MYSLQGKEKSTREACSGLQEASGSQKAYIEPCIAATTDRDEMEIIPMALAMSLISLSLRNGSTEASFEGKTEKGTF